MATKLDDIDVDQEMPVAVARKLLSRIVAESADREAVRFSPHALKEMAEDNIKETDAINVLRAGQIYEAPDLEKDSWRYRVHTKAFCVVVAFDSVTDCVVVTAWRKPEGKGK